MRNLALSPLCILAAALAGLLAPAFVSATRTIGTVELYNADTNQKVYDVVKNQYHGTNIGNYKLKVTLASTPSGWDPQCLRMATKNYNGYRWVSWTGYQVQSCSRSGRVFWTPVIQKLKTEQNLLLVYLKSRRCCSSRCSDGRSNSQGYSWAFKIVVYDPNTVGLVEEYPTLPSDVDENAYDSRCDVVPVVTGRSGSQWWLSSPLDVQGIFEDRVEFGVRQDWLDKIICAEAVEYLNYNTGNMTCDRWINTRAGEVGVAQAKCESGVVVIKLYAHDTDFDLNLDRAYWPPYCRPIEIGKGNMWTIVVPCAGNPDEVCEPEPDAECEPGDLDTELVFEDYETAPQGRSWRKNWGGPAITNQGVTSGATNYFGRVGASRTVIDRTFVFPPDASEFIMDMDLWFFGDFGSNDKLHLRVGLVDNMAFTKPFPNPGNSRNQNFGAIQTTLEHTNTEGLFRLTVVIPESEFGDVVSGVRRLVVGFYAKLSGNCDERAFGIDNFRAVMVCGDPDGPSAPSVPAPVPVGSPTDCTDPNAMPIVGLTGAPDGYFPTIDGTDNTANGEWYGAVKMNMYRWGNSRKTLLTEAYIMVDCDTNMWYVLVKINPDKASKLIWGGAHKHQVIINGGLKLDGSAGAGYFEKVYEGGKWVAWEGKFHYSGTPKTIKIRTKAYDRTELDIAISATSHQRKKICLYCGDGSTDISASPSISPSKLASSVPTRSGVPTFCGNMAPEWERVGGVCSYSAFPFQTIPLNDATKVIVRVTNHWKLDAISWIAFQDAELSCNKTNTFDGTIEYKATCVNGYATVRIWLHDGSFSATDDNAQVPAMCQPSSDQGKKCGFYALVPCADTIREMNARCGLSDSPSMDPTMARVPSVGQASHCEDGELIRGSLAGSLVEPSIDGQISPPDTSPNAEWAGATIMDMVQDGGAAVLGKVYFKVNCNTNQWYVRFNINGTATAIVPDGTSITIDSVVYISAGNTDYFPFTEGWEAMFTWNPVGTEMAPENLEIVTVVNTPGGQVTTKFSSKVCVCGNNEVTYAPTPTPTSCPPGEPYPLFRRETTPTSETTCRMLATGYTCETTTF